MRYGIDAVIGAVDAVVGLGQKINNHREFVILAMYDAVKDVEDVDAATKKWIADVRAQKMDTVSDAVREEYESYSNRERAAVRAAGSRDACAFDHVGTWDLEAWRATFDVQVSQARRIVAFLMKEGAEFVTTDKDGMHRLLLPVNTLLAMARKGSKPDADNVHDENAENDDKAFNVEKFNRMILTALAAADKAGPKVAAECVVSLREILAQRVGK